MEYCSVCNGWILGHGLYCNACGRGKPPRLPDVTLSLPDAMELTALCGYSPGDKKALELVRMAWKKGVRDVKDKVKGRVNYGTY